MPAAAGQRDRGNRDLDFHCAVATISVGRLPCKANMVPKKPLCGKKDLYGNFRERIVPFARL
jgi:hypothetical protein